MDESLKSEVQKMIRTALAHNNGKHSTPKKGCFLCVDDKRKARQEALHDDPNSTPGGSPIFWN